VLDSSVLVGIIRGEPDTGRLLNLLASKECAIGAPTLVEARLVLSQPGDPFVGVAQTLYRCGPGNNYSV
jgi:hypothetical protein